MKKATDEQIYPACLIACALLLAAFLAWYCLLGQPALAPCWFYTRWHAYCPGCGGTRALTALLQGNFLQSLYYHPAVLFTVLSVGAYLLSQTLWRLRGRRGFVLRYDDRWLWTLAGVLMLHCCVRNLLWFGFGIPL